MSHLSYTDGQNEVELIFIKRVYVGSRKRKKKESWEFFRMIFHKVPVMFFDSAIDVLFSSRKTLKPLRQE